MLKFMMSAERPWYWAASWFAQKPSQGRYLLYQIGRGCESICTEELKESKRALTTVHWTQVC